jgi:hypothetical protein
MPVETPAATKAKKPIYKNVVGNRSGAIFVIGGISQTDDYCGHQQSPEGSSCGTPRR